MNARNLPPLPKIDGGVELTLAVFTHRSVNVTLSAAGPAEYDSDRLAVLGEQALELVVTSYLYCKRPVLDARNIQDCRRDILKDETIIQWLNLYDLRAKLIAEPRILEDPQEMKRFFLTYVGALFESCGLSTVEHWIVSLIDPSASPVQTSPSASSYSSQHSSLPPQYSAPIPAPPLSPPPPLPLADYPPAVSSPTSVAPLSWLSLATVNQTAAQKHAIISYQVEPADGPSHSPTWTVHCYIDGQERGLGKGKSQKAAKEEAARNAYLSMGWMQNV